MTAEAAQTYAERAEMGGWDEEAWYARLQQARCLLELGDEGGFLREALVAFNQRPQRAEPLYDLARFYRERGMNDASVLFSEAGLAIKRPEQDILFLQDFVYTAGLQEEYSIAANYARDAARKDRGFSACNRLALNRNVPDRTRELAWSNLFFYLQPANAMLPSFTARRVGFTPPEGYSLTNPSITTWGDQIIIGQPSVNYTLTEDGLRYHMPGGSIRTRNFLLRLTNELDIQSAKEILLPVDMPNAAYNSVLGFEDMRPFAWRGDLWCCSCVRELTPEGWCEQVLGRIDDGGPDGPRLMDWRVIHPEGPRRHEMNWIPQVAGERLQFISSCDPTRVLDEQARTIAETTPAIAAGHFGGSSQTITFDGGWLALIHEALEKPPTTRQCRQHRFVWFDESNRLRNISRPFFFHQKGAEFASGLSWHPDRTRLLVSYGVGDGESWIATVDAEEVRGTLENLNRPPFGAPDQTREHVEEPKATAKFPSSNEAAAVTGAHDSKASVPTGSTWTPKVRAAGTELMVAGLKERMGPELDQINLQINHPGHDDGDTRPRVVWMHHDINQQWVQWCKDKALVDLVRCFVFVSHWQRERYLNAFGLPPQRCCVLRHAVDLHPNLRTWDTAPVWRCAYTSTPFRGLAVLLDAWGRLRPLNAELHIWSSMKLYLGDDGPYNHLYERARAMPKVVYHGIEPNLELRAALRNMHFLVYPNIFQETACLAVIEAMAAGCRVIVPSLGALPETTGGYARVYPWNPDAQEHAVVFSEMLEDEMTTPWAGRPELALNQQSHCAAVYSWPQRLWEWRQLIRWVCTSGTEAALAGRRPSRSASK